MMIISEVSAEILIKMAREKCRNKVKNNTLTELLSKNAKAINIIYFLPGSGYTTSNS